MKKHGRNDKWLIEQQVSLSPHGLPLPPAERSWEDLKLFARADLSTVAATSGADISEYLQAHC